MEEQVYSLSSVSVTLSNPYYGDTTFGYKFNMGGGGKLMEQVSYSYSQENFSQSVTADGGATTSFNKSRAGTITVDLKQTSPYIKQLVEFINWCIDNPEKAFSEMTIRDTAGNIKCDANGVVPSKIPDNSITGTAGNRTFTFNAKEIIASY